MRFIPTRTYPVPKTISGFFVVTCVLSINHPLRAQSDVPDAAYTNGSPRL
jgi:hypothetical protein